MMKSGHPQHFKVHEKLAVSMIYISQLQPCTNKMIGLTQ